MEIQPVTPSPPPAPPPRNEAPPPEPPQEPPRKAEITDEEVATRVDVTA